MDADVYITEIIDEHILKYNNYKDNRKYKKK